jgi:glutaryl-CoA dehydrogenase
MKNFENYLAIDSLFSEEHILIRKSVRDWVSKNILPIIEKYNQENISLHEKLREMGQMGFIASFIPEQYGGSGLDYLSYGLIMQELERGDSALRSSASVQTSLVIVPILKFGSEEQKLKYIPRLAKGEIIGSFGLTEPNHGSDPARMETKFRETTDGFILNGSKLWITNANVCDIAIVWAKGDKGEIRGFIVERKFKGFTTNSIKNKWSLRASDTGELVFSDLLVPKENILPDVVGLKGPMTCLNSARFGIAWGALGAAASCIEVALNYSNERKQFNKTLNSFQLTQKKLSEMTTEFLKAQLLAYQVGLLMNKGTATPAQISMIKRNNVTTALQIARESRQILGAIGITGDYPIMRHLMNLESVVTYEGTHDIHLLITGQDLTGVAAFA